MSDIMYSVQNFIAPANEMSPFFRMGSDFDFTEPLKKCHHF